MKKNVQSKRTNEIRVLKKMFRVYCRLNHGTKSGYCDECNNVLEYVTTRIHKCPFRETKSFCSICKIPCYKPEMIEKVRKVIRFTSKKMIWFHPVDTFRYLYAMNIEKKKLKRNKIK